MQQLPPWHPASSAALCSGSQRTCFKTVLYVAFLCYKVQTLHWGTQGLSCLVPANLSCSLAPPELLVSPRHTGLSPASMRTVPATWGQMKPSVSYLGETSLPPSPHPRWPSPWSLSIMSILWFLPLCLPVCLPVLGQDHQKQGSRTMQSMRGELSGQTDGDSGEAGEGRGRVRTGS